MSQDIACSTYVAEQVAEKLDSLVKSLCRPN